MGQPTIEALREGVRGQDITGHDDGYEEARTVYNAMHDRRPAVVVRCVDAGDVVAAVNFALGGGIGYLARGCGLSLDNLLSVDVATADGRFLPASERENEDVFWALRGGGGNFGVVTSLESHRSILRVTNA